MCVHSRWGSFVGGDSGARYINSDAFHTSGRGSGDGEPLRECSPHGVGEGGNRGTCGIVASATGAETEANDRVGRSLNSSSSGSSDQLWSMDLVEIVPSFDFGEIYMLEAEDYYATATDRSYGSDSSGGSDSGEDAIDSDGYRTGGGGGKSPPRAGDEGPVLRMERPFDRGKAFGV